MKPKPPADIATLARELGYSPKQVRKMQAKHGAKLLKMLQKQWRQIQDTPRLLHRDSSHGYTSDPQFALHAEPEAVRDEDQRAITAKAHDVWAMRREEVASEEEMRRQERAVRDRLREVCKGLSPVARQALLARIERDLRQAQVLEKAA